MSLQTAERVSTEMSDNYVFARSLLAYLKAAEVIEGDVLEVGSGMGYGIEYVAPKAATYLAIDKYNTDIDPKHDNVRFQQMNVPPFEGIEDNTFDYVVSFQVIEHIQDDNLFVKEIHRVLKPGGKFVVTTPNKKMSITRNPWHIREYTIQELIDLLGKHFTKVDAQGVFGNDKINDYYEKNKASVRKITRFDIFDLQHRLPRQLLQIPYDILNRLNRRKLLKENTGLVSDISHDDYHVAEAKKGCYDLFYIATK